MPDNPTNPFDKAMRDYEDLRLDRDEWKQKYELCDDELLKAAEAARNWEQQAEFFRTQALEAQQRERNLAAKLVELTTAGKNMVDIGREFTRIAEAINTTAPQVEEKPEPMPEFLTNSNLPENRL